MYLEDRMIINTKINLDIGFFTFVPDYSSLGRTDVSQKHPILKVHTWKILMDPDQVQGVQDHP